MVSVDQIVLPYNIILIHHFLSLVPPSFGEKETSSDTDIREGSNVKLHCKAYGRPVPDISWRREDEKVIVTGTNNSTMSVVSFRGETLNLVNVSRHQIGKCSLSLNRSCDARVRLK